MNRFSTIEELPYEHLEAICADARLPREAVYLLNSIAASTLRKYSPEDVAKYIRLLAFRVSAHQMQTCPSDPECAMFLLRTLDEYHAS